MSMLKLTGWVEVNGQRLTPEEIEVILQNHPEEILRFGGEFFFAGHGCRARDHFGIMRGNCPKGTLICDGVVKGQIDPAVPDMPLEEAIITAVRLRSDEGVTALSGGVDSTLVAHLARRECVAVGLEGSHDLRQARHAADTLGLSCTYVTITPDEIEEALPVVVGAIPKKDPLNTGIALTQYFIARFAGEQGTGGSSPDRVPTRLFGGIRGTWKRPRLAADLERDFLGLEQQAARDQASCCTARHLPLHALPGLPGCARCARDPRHEKVRGGSGKSRSGRWQNATSLEFAWYEKKAMQYGSGVWKVLQKLARKKGYKTSVQDYIDHIDRVDHGH